MEITWISNNFMMQYNRFEEALRQKLANAEMTPRPLVWEGIEGHLPQPKEPNNRNKFIWISILVLVCFLGVLGGLYMQKPQNEALITVNAKKDVPLANNSIAQSPLQNTDLNHTNSSKITSIQQTPTSRNTTNPQNLNEKKHTNLLTSKAIVSNEITTSYSVANPSVPTTDKDINPLQITSPKEVSKTINPLQTPSLKDEVILKNKVILQSSENAATQSQIVDKNLNKEETSIANKPHPTSSLLAQSNKGIQKINPITPSVSNTAKNTEIENAFSKIKRGKQKKWEIYGSVGGNALVHGVSFQSTDDKILSPVKLNTTGIIQLELVDSFEAVQLENMTQFKDYIQTHDVMELRIIESSYAQFVATGLSYRIKPYLGIEAGIRVQKQDFSTRTIAYNRYQTFYDMYKNRVEAQRIGGLNYSTYVIETPFWINSYLPLGTSRVEGIFSIGATYRRWMLDKRVSGFAKAARGTPNSNPDLLQLDALTHSTSAFYRKHNFSIQARVGAQFHLTRNLSWFTAANIQYLTNQMYKSTFSEKKPVIVGLETGIRF